MKLFLSRHKVFNKVIISAPYGDERQHELMRTYHTVNTRWGMFSGSKFRSEMILQKTATPTTYVDKEVGIRYEAHQFTLDTY